GRDATRNGPPGRGRTRAAREDHQRRRRVPGERATERRGPRDRRASDRAPAALPADPARDRRLQLLDDHLPGADRPDQTVPRANDRAAHAHSIRRTRTPPGGLTMTALVSSLPLGIVMPASSLAYSIGALLLAWATVQLRGRPAYSCPACGSKRADGHSEECPWRS